MFNPDFPPASAYLPSLETAARSLKVELIPAPVHSEVEIEMAIIALGREAGGGLVVMPDVFNATHRESIILAAARNNVPVIYPQSSYARDGGLLSYGPDQLDIIRRGATYVDRILRGAKPGDLPVQFPTKFEVVVNLKTAKALDITVPQSILLRADELRGLSRAALAMASRDRRRLSPDRRSMKVKNVMQVARRSSSRVEHLPC